MPRLVVMTSLATGACADLELGRWRGENACECRLAMRLLRSTAQGDVIVGDRYFGTFAFIASLVAAGRAFVGRHGNGGRIADFRRGIRLGSDDHLVVWEKPRSCGWMSPEEFAALPDRLVLRELRVPVAHPGARTRRLTLVTTMLSPTKYPATALAELYRHRWHVELDLRSIKQVMGLDQLRCRTPHMLAVEAWTTVLAYNLVRAAMQAAGLEGGVEPRRLSFKASLALVALARSIGTPSTAWLLEALAHQLVPTRADRLEPRQLKRNPRKFDMLKRPRSADAERGRRARA